MATVIQPESATPAARLQRARGPVAEIGIRSVAGRKRRVLHGKMVPFNEWAEVDSVLEGHFMESFAPGSVDKTFAENRDRMRCIHFHGRDVLGKLVLGKIIDLHSDERWAYYEVELFEAVEKESPLLIEGIEAGEYGTSLYFELMNGPLKRVGRSSYNPKGIDERRVLEAKVIEFGPTPFAIYPSTTAGLRSLTDEVTMQQLASDPERFRTLAERTGISVPDVPDTPDDDEKIVAGDNVALTARRTTAEDPKTARRYARAAEFVGSTPWALHPAVLAVGLQIIGERIQGHRPDPEEIAERIAGARGSRARDDDETSSSDSPVRVINVRGPIVPHAGMMADISTPGRSVESIQDELHEAVASEDVKRILLNIDSPGGSVSLVPELAADLLDARKVKPITALANTWAGSAAYWIFAAASEGSVTPSGEVGSIGVYSAHEDRSELEAKAGVKTTLISAGRYKVEGNPYEPLDDEARDYLQEQVDAYYKMFLKGVARGRDVTVKTVENDFGQGRMVLAEKAVELGMADRVETFEQALTRLEREAAKSNSTRAAALLADAPEPSEATTRDRADGPPASEPLHSTSTTTLYGKSQEAKPWLL